MATLHRGGKALLVIDVQVGVVGEAHNREAVLASINVAVDKARAAGVPVVWVQHSDSELVLESPEWQLAPEMKPAAGEHKIRKTYRSSFVETNLEEVLAELGADHLVICGAETNNCVRHTSHTALERGYDVTLIGDAHTTTGFEWNGYIIDAARVIDEQNTNFMGYKLPGRMADIVSSADLSF
jgi:nicotinamidase-related amidase